MGFHTFLEELGLGQRLQCEDFVRGVSEDLESLSKFCFVSEKGNVTTPGPFVWASIVTSKKKFAGKDLQSTAETLRKKGLRERANLGPLRAYWGHAQGRESKGMDGLQKCRTIHRK